MIALRRFCEALGWTGLRRSRARGPSRAEGREEALPAEAAIVWPPARVAPPPGMVYARQIAACLGHRTPERVLNYHLLEGPDGSTLPGGPPFAAEPHVFDGRNLFAYDEHWESYCSEEHARQIVERIRYCEGRA